MRHKFATSVMVVASAFVQPAVAAPKIVTQPIQLSTESIRYQHGVASVDQFADNGSIQVRPAGLDHGSLVFNVAVFNTGSQPANIDVSNFSLATDVATVSAMTVDVLEAKARSRAAWTQFGLALAGGLSAAAAASSRDTYRSTLITPHGTYRGYYSAPSALGQATAVASIAAAGVGIAETQNRLDQTLEALGTQIMQMTTVDPGDSYAGTIIFQKVKFTKLPMKVTMTVDWNGRKYPFAFQIAKPSTPAPAFTAAPIVERAETAQAPAATAAPAMQPAVLQSPTPTTPALVPAAMSTAPTPVTSAPVTTPSPAAAPTVVAQPASAGISERKAPPPGCSALVPGSCGDYKF